MSYKYFLFNYLAKALHKSPWLNLTNAKSMVAAYFLFVKPLYFHLFNSFRQAGHVTEAFLFVNQQL